MTNGLQTFASVRFALHYRHTTHHYPAQLTPYKQHSNTLTPQHTTRADRYDRDQFTRNRQHCRPAQVKIHPRYCRMQPPPHDTKAFRRIYTPKEHHSGHDQLTFQPIHESDPAALRVPTADAACHPHFAS